MQNKSRKLNGISAQRTLAKEIEASTKKLEQQRWLKTPEGEAYLLKKDQILKTAETVALFKIGQLVWKDVVFEVEDPFSHGNVGSRCCKITAIFDDSVDMEMLYIIIKGNKFYEYNDIWNGPCVSGDVFSANILDLEKHVAKSSGNIWWKVRVY